MLGEGEQYGGKHHHINITLQFHHNVNHMSFLITYHKPGWMVSRKENSTFGDHLGREHFKHQLEERLGDHLGEQLGDHLGLQPLHQLQQDALPPPHLDLTLVS